MKVSKKFHRGLDAVLVFGRLTVGILSAAAILL